MKDLDNINKNDLDVLRSLVNPDERNVDAKKYRFDPRYQQEILSMLLMDKVFLIQSMQLIEPKYFVDKSHEVICGILFKYFNKYKQLPAKFVIYNEIREKYPNDEKKILVYAAELESLTSSYIPGLESRDACLDKITEFAKEQSLRMAISNTLDLLERNSEDKFVKIEDLFKKALLTDRSFDIGLDYFQTLEERYERMEEQSKNRENFVTGFDSIDGALSSLGLIRGEVGAYFGVSGAGKSVMLTKTCVENILRGKKVLYLSLEMSADKISRRFDALLSQENIRTLLDKKDIVIPALKEHVKGEEDKRKLIIKQFPSGEVDVPTVYAFLSQLALSGFNPDMLCIDYIGEFKDDPSIKVYESRQRIVRDLRGLAVRENVCIFTALQANRRGRDDQEGVQSVIDDASIGDSYGQIRPLDLLLSLNQSPNEKNLGIGRLFVVKARDGKSRFNVYYKQNLETLGVQEISSETHANLLSQVKIKTSESVDKVMEKYQSKKFKPNRE